MKMIINGKKVDSESGKTFNVTDPATGKVIEAVPKATEKDIEAAVDAAVTGQKIWAEIPVWQLNTRTNWICHKLKYIFSINS